jgi:hypothetical protein
MKSLNFLLIFLFCSLSVFCQKNLSLSGTLIDTNDEPVVAGSVELLKLRDSSYVAGLQSNTNGVFTFKNLDSAKYIVRITFIGFTPIVQNVDLNGKQPVTNLGKLVMQANEILLSEITVEGKQPDVIVKGDTLEYDAASFKTQEHAVVEDLLKKLPGVEVDKDGKITAAGKEVKKFLLDGEEFFANDPTVASKNLPVEMVDKLQVIERKSEMARMTGFDDGEEETIINLTIRPGMKKGTFANAMAGLGQDLAIDNDSRYQAGAFVNSMQNSNRFNLILGSNNNNNVGASDLGARQFGGGRMGRGGDGGITQSNNIAFALQKRFSPALNLNGDLRLGNSDKISKDKVTQTTNSQKLSQLDKSLSNSDYFSQSASLNFTVEWKPDTLNSLTVRPNITINSSHNDEDEGSDRFNNETNDTIFKTVANSYMKDQNYSFGGSLNFAHKFSSKRGRVISMSMNGTYSDSYNKERSLWLSQNFTNGIYDNDTERNQRIENDRNSGNYRINLSYVEPIGRNNFLQASYRYSHSGSKNINSTYDLLSDNSVYDLLYENPDLSVIDTAIIKGTQSRSTLRNSTEQRIGLSFKSVREKYNYTIGFNVDPSSSLNETYQPYSETIPVQHIPGDFDGRLINVMGDSLISSIPLDVINFSPVLNYVYNFDRRSNFRIDYQGQTSQPSANQLRDYIDESRPTNLTKGNPNLKPGYSNTLSTSFKKYIVETQLTYNFNLNGGFSMNDIVGVTNMREDGIRMTTYENVNGNWNVSGQGTFNTPLKNKKFTVSSTISGSFRNTNSFADSIKNIGKSLSFGDRMGINYRSDLFDISLNGSFNYSHITYSARPTNNQDTRSYGGGLSTTWYLPYKFTINSDINFTTRSGFADGFNRSETIWNASAIKQLFSKRTGTGSIKLQIFDILHDRKSIRASATTNGYRNSETMIIPSFFMGSFIYKFTLFPNSSSSSFGNDRGGERRQRGDGEGGNWGGGQGGGRGGNSGGGGRSF